MKWFEQVKSWSPFDSKASQGGNELWGGERGPNPSPSACYSLHTVWCYVAAESVYFCTSSPVIPFQLSWPILVCRAWCWGTLLKPQICVSAGRARAAHHCKSLVPFATRPVPPFHAIIFTSEGNYLQTIQRAEVRGIIKMPFIVTSSGVQGSRHLSFRTASSSPSYSCCGILFLLASWMQLLPCPCPPMLIAGFP